MKLWPLSALPLLLMCALPGVSQSTDYLPGTLDPTRNIVAQASNSLSGPTLSEEYIWTATAESGAAKGAESADQAPAASQECYFRRTFMVKKMPGNATLYVAGPSSVQAYLNGSLVLRGSMPTDSVFFMRVFTADVTKYLKPGKNVLALEVVPSRVYEPIANTGRVLVSKIIPASRGVLETPLVLTNRQWKGTGSRFTRWDQTDYDDGMWAPVRSVGGMNDQSEFSRVNIDTGLYDWPGYSGVAPFLRHFYLAPQSISRVFKGTSTMRNLSSLVTGEKGATAANDFTIMLSESPTARGDVPSIVLDFGKEVTGWLEFVSSSDKPMVVTVEYGESEDEAEHGAYLGANSVFIPAHGIAHGPQSAFRYAKVRFAGSPGTQRFESIRLNGIYYPVKYAGSFESSDPLLNRIWEVGAYTAHLCMQDAIWDAPKRDRNLFSGDMDVSGDVIDSVFADHYLMENTMARLIGDGPVSGHVNDIAGYSAFWIMELADYDRHVGSTAFLESMHKRLVELMTYMESDLDENHVFANLLKGWPFVDWSLNLDGDTPEAIMATDFEFYSAFVQGASLLRQMGDLQTAEHFENLAKEMRQAAKTNYLNPQTGNFGTRWQTNAMAVYSGLADETQYDAIWSNVLSSIDRPGANSISSTQHYDYNCCAWIGAPPVPYKVLTITPYYNYYVISAMAETGHRDEALKWIRKYWGGMVSEGATSFWEAYDPSWPKVNFHASLQADGTEGYTVSLAHGWSSGPTAWLMEQILGIEPTAEGFRDVTIRPDLAGLTWARGTEPTPKGPIHVDLKGGDEQRISLGIPDGVTATVLVPVMSHTSEVMVNGRRTKGELVEGDRRLAITLASGGLYEIVSSQAPAR